MQAGWDYESPFFGNKPELKMKSTPAQLLNSTLNRELVFVHGKGGVGKTVLSRAIAYAFASQNNKEGHPRKTLWVTLEDPTLPLGKVQSNTPFLWQLNCDFGQAFEEYAGMKIKAPRLASLFLNNKLIRYLASAAPGVHELVLLGKIWHERKNYERVVVDMPSTGYGLALFQSAENFSKLFKSGPLHQDAQAMIDTFRDPKQSGHLIVGLPEETPLRESLELNEFLTQLFPDNPSAFLANRLFPQVSDPVAFDPKSKPVADSIEDYARKRSWLESHNLRIWSDAQVTFGELSYIAPPKVNAPDAIVQALVTQLRAKDYL